LLMLKARAFLFNVIIFVSILSGIENNDNQVEIQS
jgi:hypothetical protein